MIFTAFSVVNSLCSSAFASGKQDVYIFENPQTLTIFDRFESLLSKEDLKKIAPHTPFFVINRNSLLGDQVTPVARCRVQGQTYSVLLNERGAIYGVKGKVDHLKNCIITDDTIYVSDNATLVVYERCTGGAKRATAKAGRMLYRLFKYNTCHYLLVPGADAKYGWSNLSGNKSWRLPDATTKVTEALPGDILKRIREHIDSVNTLYTRYFVHFNVVLQTQRNTPKWSVKTEGNSVRFILDASGADMQRLENSTIQLVRDLENIIMGRPFVINYSRNEILIRPAKQ